MRGLLRRLFRRRTHPPRYPLLAKGETMDCSPLWPTDARPDRPTFATGGVLPIAPLEGDQIPAILSPCLSTVRRPGETWVEAMRRLEEGEEL
jgi:hypothetical protein